MAPGNEDSFWLTTLCNQIQSLCSDADYNIIPQEPIEYVRNQFLTAGENILQFYREFVDSVLPESPPEVINAPTHPITEHHCHVSADLPDDHAPEMYAVKFPSTSSPDEPVVMICTENREVELIPEQDDEMVLNNHSVRSGVVEEVHNDAHTSLSILMQAIMADLSEEIEEGSYNFPGPGLSVQLADEVTSTLTRALSTQPCDTNDELAESIDELVELGSTDSSSDTDEYISAGEDSDDCITDQLRERDMLDQSTIMQVDISDFDIENATSLSTISEVDDEKTKDCAKQRVTWHEDSSDSDWEFV